MRLETSVIHFQLQYKQIHIQSVSHAPADAVTCDTMNTAYTLRKLELQMENFKREKDQKRRLEQKIAVLTSQTITSAGKFYCVYSSVISNTCLLSVACC